MKTNVFGLKPNFNLLPGSRLRAINLRRARLLFSPVYSYCKSKTKIKSELYVFWPRGQGNKTLDERAFDRSLT